MIDYEQYHQKGGFYQIPVEIFDDLLEENKNLKKKIKSLTSKSTSKKIHGEYKNVRLTEKEFQMLIECYGEEQTKQLITYLDEYIEMKGYKAKSHYLCIKKWVVEAIKEKTPKYNNPGAKVEQVPAWLNKQVDYEKPTDKEVAELRELLKDFE